MNHEFDEFAHTYRDEQTKHLTPTGENSLYFAQLKAKKLKEWLPFYLQNTPQTILDFGCGDGMMTQEVSTLFPNTKIYGVDPSAESIELAKKAAPTAELKLSGTDLHFFQSNTFDVIYCAGVFHHIPFGEHTHYLQELHRVLRPGGILVIFELNPLNPGTAYIFNGHPMEKNAKMLTPWYAKKLTQPFGYKQNIFYCFFPHFLRAFRPLEKLFTAIPFGGLYATIAQK